MKSPTILFISLLFATMLFAQPVDPPAIALWQVYDNGIEFDDTFHDIFATPDNGFIMCGESYEAANNGGSVFLVRIDEDYRDIWNRRYDFNRTRSKAFSVIQTDDGNFLVGGNSGSNASPEFFAMLVNADGEPIWNRQYVHEQSGGKVEAVIELKGGNFILAGAANTYPWEGHDGYVLCVEPNGEVLWEFVHPTTIFMTMRETEGGIVLAGQEHGQNPNCTIIIKLNFDGELLWEEFPGIGGMVNQPDGANSMVSSPEGGFAVAGGCYVSIDNVRDPVAYLLKINAEGQREWVRHYDINPPERGTALGLAKMNDGSGYIITGQRRILVGDEDWPTRVMQAIRVTSRGMLRWRSHLPAGEVLNLPTFRAGLNNGAIIGADNSMLAVGSSTQDDLMDNRHNNHVAVLVKLEPDNLPAPYIIFLPEDSLQSALPGDSITFSTEPVNFFNEQISYLWALDEDTLANDDRTNSMIVTFPDFGEYEMYGAVFAEGVLAGETTWRITVEDFFIRSASPDSSDITVRRNSTVPFYLDVACVEPNAWTCRWDYIDRNQRHNPLGEGDSLDITFDLTGECAVEALVEWNGEQESVSWAVEVRSAIWWWAPHLDSVTVYQDSLQEFSVSPFNEDSDSLAFEWTLNGELLDWTEELLALDEMDLGDHQLTAVCHDGAEADTVGWVISVIERNSAPNREAQLPTESTLYPPVPNPFNSMTRIDYYIVQAGNINLTLFDLSGREVRNLVDGVSGAGRHSVTLNASDLAAGVYVAVLRGEGFVKREKVVLVR